MADQKGPDLSRRPEDSDFQQQRLKAWQPLLTPKWVIGTFFVIGIIFLPVGIGILVTSNKVVEQSVRYDTMAPVGCNPMDATTCQHVVNITIAKDMDAPVFVYYRLSNFFQNHRRYVKSRSDPQLHGDDWTASLSNCDPLEKINGLSLYPCGLIANSFFNDRFNATLFPAATPNDGTFLAGASWQRHGIAWSSDINDKFKPVTGKPFPNTTVTRVGTRNFTLPDVTDEDFIVWMRTAGLPTFKKLYRKIENVNLKAGDILSIMVENVFPVASFSGEKAIVLSTTSWLGGKNDFLGWAYIVVAILCLVLGALFLAKHIISPRPLGDMKYFNFATSKTTRGS